MEIRKVKIQMFQGKTGLRILVGLFLWGCFTLGPLWGQTPAGVDSGVRIEKIEWPSWVMKGIKTTIPIHLEISREWKKDSIIVMVNGTPFKRVVKDQKVEVPVTLQENQNVEVVLGEQKEARYFRPIPLWLSILPPLIAIIMALFIKEVFSSLFLGLLAGTFIINFYREGAVFMGLSKGFFAIVDTYVLQSLSESGHISIIIFSMLIGGMVHIITRNGGMRGLVNNLSRYASTPRSGQMVTWLLGIFIFFDDYANTLVVGNTMRPISDRLRISREKLAYIVDSTAAPIVSIAFVTTWIGAELSYIQAGIQAIGIDESPYNVFLNSLSFSFYPVLTILFILFLIWKGVDYGPMLKAELLARKGEKILPEVNPDEGEEHEIDPARARWYNAIIPVLIVIVGTLAGLVYTGWDQAVWNDVSKSYTTRISDIIGAADSYQALMWASLLATVVAIILSMVQRILNLRQCMESLVAGFKTMLSAVLVLVMAWSIALVTTHLHTADFISQILLDVQVAPWLLPALTFVFAAIVSFSTGSSWGTMAILYPLILPATWLICSNNGLDHEQAMLIFHNVVSTVLAGSVLGDHCSPISDTTILSSLASSCNHISHVRTQMPYALTVGSISVVLGTIPAGLGVPSWILFPIGILAVWIVVTVFGKKVTMER